MRHIILSTESGADIPQHLVKKYFVQIVPMNIKMDGLNYMDGQISVHEILAYHLRTKMAPLTAPASVQEYETFFKGIFDKNPQCAIVHICYTSKASLSFKNACIAAERFENIYIVDGKNVTGGLATVVLYAAEQIENDPQIEVLRLVELLEKVIPKVRFKFVAGNEDFLVAGGRVNNLTSTSEAFTTKQPCIELVNGSVVSTKSYSGKTETIVQELIQDFLEKYPVCRKQLTVMYSLGLSESIQHSVNEYLKEKGFEKVIWMEAGAIISTHTGPGGFGITGIEQ